MLVRKNFENLHAVMIGVARIFDWVGLKFKKSYPTAETDPENCGGGNADMN